MKLILLVFIAFSYGCISSRVFNGEPNQALQNYSEISFDDIDLDEDGNITSTEVNAFNKNSTRSSSTVISAPIWTTIAIISLTLIMCAVSSVIRCNRSE